MIDAQPGDGWIVPAAVAWALFEDARAADEAMAAAEPLWDRRANGHPNSVPPDQHRDGRPPNRRGKALRPAGQAARLARGRQRKRPRPQRPARG